MKQFRVHHSADDSPDVVTGEKIVYSLDPVAGTLCIHRSENEDPFLMYAHGHWKKLEVEELDR